MIRIVSMIASSTEIVCALGCEHLLVGRSHECDFPTTIRNLPITTETKFIADGTSYQIDERIKGILQEGLSVYRVKGEILKSLRPSVIITQTQCEVCAVSLKDVEEATCTWLESRPKIVSLHPNQLSDIWADIARVAETLGVQEKGEILVQQLQSRIEKLSEQANQFAQKSGKRPRVACIEWLSPLMAAGNWVPELVALAGGENLFGQPGKHSPWMTWNDLEAKDPDILAIMPCGFDIARTQEEMFNLTTHPHWSTLKAVREGQVYLLDGNQYFNRPGPRIVDSLEILVEIFYPQEAHRRFEQDGWKLF